MPDAPAIIPYADVLAAAEATGLQCVYPNGAAFAPAGCAWAIAGWITGPDPTLRPAARERSTVVAADALPGLLEAAWSREYPASAAWLAPVHHWAAELDHGADADGRTIAKVLEAAGVDVAALHGRRQADALAFAEPPALAALVSDLLPLLWKTDFTVLFPGHRATLTIHHHQQLWWRCADAALADRLLRGAEQVQPL